MAGAASHPENNFRVGDYTPSWPGHISPEYVDTVLHGGPGNLVRILRSILWRANGVLII